jgi:RNA polymerase sigma factor (sigma-70 family)
MSTPYQSHARELHGFARRRVGRQEAEDVVQDAYLHLLQKGAAAALEHPRAYLFRIAANLAIDAIRKTKTRLRYADDEIEFLSFALANAAPEAAIERAFEIRRFQTCLAELPPRCSEVFLLNLIDGLTHAEIAKRLGISVRTVDRHIVKALDHLRRRLLHLSGKAGTA